MTLNFNFNNTYTSLPEYMTTKLSPTPVKNPEMIILNYDLAENLGLNFKNVDLKELSNIFSGSKLPPNTETFSQAYAGHQFGHFVILGDGRAHMLGEQIKPDGSRVDIQFKGSGKTPYSRSGDGRAALGPMLREYIISEAMHYLKIPTTRSLSVVKTGESILRESKLQGAVLTRVASSHLRVGTFQFVASNQDIKTLSELVNYTVERHFPEIKNNKNLALELFKKVLNLQIDLVTNWMRVGFVHGVMNTDNMAISGETIDYGPCAFMDNYDPQTVFSSIDHYGRYAYINQPVIAHWNLVRFAETLIPLIDSDQSIAIKKVETEVLKFDELYKKSWFKMMKSKVGIIGEDENDLKLINDLLSLMHRNQSDYTNTFRNIMNGKLPKESLFNDPDFIFWEETWKNRLKKNNQPDEKSYDLMKSSNPVLIPRNHLVEEVLSEAENNQLDKLNKILNKLKNPYDEVDEEVYLKPAPPSDKIYKTFCGT